MLLTTNIFSIIWGPNPTITSIGPFQLRYYGLLFISGFIIGYFIFIKIFKKEGVPQSALDPLLYTTLFATMVGARLVHCLFYQPEYYLARPVEILKVWEGGLASHGGAIGILIALIWYVNKYGKKYKFDYLWLLDRLGIVTALAGCMIRLGNLMNSEIYGRVTDLPWGFIFVRRGETLPKHPTQIYEALIYLALFITLYLLYTKKLRTLKKGVLFSIFLIGVFGARFIIEFIKEPQVSFENEMILNMGQILSIPFIIGGIILLIYSIKRDKPAMRQA